MYDLQIYTRKSHTYASGWDWLDQWEFVGTARITPPKVVREGNAFDFAGVALQWAQLPAGVDAAAAAQAIVDTLSVSNCRHEYDCCGCLSQTATIVRRNRRRLLVRTSAWRNY